MIKERILFLKKYELLFHALFLEYTCNYKKYKTLWKDFITTCLLISISLLGAKEDINPHSPRTNISMSISVIY